jgi:hypothetical protein
MKFPVYALALLVCVAAVVFGFAKDIAIGIAASVIAAILFFVPEDLGEIWLWVKTKTWSRKKEIRISASYLFRIKCHDKYLLIKGRNIDQLQPVGGVFKVLRRGLGRMRELEVREDNNTVKDVMSKDDLRIMLPRKNVYDFLEWFKTRKGRETSAWREFYEELIRPGYLPIDEFPYIHVDLIRTRQTPIRNSPHFQCDEILIAEIYEPVFNSQQQKAIEALRTDDKYDSLMWVSEAEIRQHRIEPETGLEIRIAEHAEWTI